MKYSEVEELCKKHGKSVEKFDAFMHGQTVGIVDGEIDYYECDVERFIGVQIKSKGADK